MSWPLVALSEFCKTGSGGTPSRKIPEYYEGDIPWIKSGDLRENIVTQATEFISELAVEKSSAKMVPKGAILLAMYGATVGRMAILGLDAATNQAVCSIIPDEKKAFPKYVYYALLDKVPEFLRNAVGGAQPNINQGMIKDTKIPLPYPDDPEKSLKEQKRIAAILDKADGIRRKRQQAIQLADDFLRSVFLDMFGDPITNPKGWEVKVWEDCLRIVNGKNQKKVESENGSYPICGSGGEMSRADDWLVERNSVIIGRKGNINSPILMKERFWNVDTAFGLEPKLEQLSHNYLFWFCKFFNFERLNKAVTIPSLTKADLLNVELPLPNINLQKEFDSVVDKVDVYLEKAFDFESNKSFEALSQKAFKGEL